MKQVTLLELKNNLSALVNEAAQGERILITRHKHPVAFLGSAGFEHLRVGSQFGKGCLSPLLLKATKGRYLQFLQNDRKGSSESR